MANWRSVTSRALFVCALSLSPLAVVAEPQNGWWWNPNESGRGYFIEMTGGVFYLAGYFYDNSGRATWASASGAVTDLYSISGTLQSYRNGQSMFGAYRRPDAAVDVGTISIAFKDDSHGTMTWPGGTVTIERQIFDTDAVPIDLPKTGWWWNPAESGSGYSVEIQGTTVFVVAFMYDESGNPIWYLTAGGMDSPTHFEGDWLEYSGGQTMSGPYRTPTSRNLGRVAIDFTALDQGTITFTEGTTVKRLKKASAKSAKAGGRSRSSAVIPQFTGPLWTGNQFWPHFNCTITQIFHAETEAGTTGRYFLDEGYTYHVQFDFESFSPAYGVNAATYRVNSGRSYFDYTYHTTDTSNSCIAEGRRSNITPISGELEIKAYLTYSGFVHDTAGSSVTVSESCPGEVATTRSQRIEVDVPIDGHGSTLQQPNPFPAPPALPPAPPYMRVLNSHAEPDGSSTQWGWSCEASP
jgi:hypothetical protein